MSLEELIKTKKFLEEMSVSINNIIVLRFPEMTREEREDVDHDVKLKIWKMISRGKKIENLRSYLWRVAYTTALDVLEGKMRNASLDELAQSQDPLPLLDFSVASPETRLEKRELRQMIGKAINSLPERRKTVLRLRVLGMDLQEIAEFLGWSENQVRHLFYRGLDDLKEEFQKFAGKTGF